VEHGRASGLEDRGACAGILCGGVGGSEEKSGISFEAGTRTGQINLPAAEARLSSPVTTPRPWRTPKRLFLVACLLASAPVALAADKPEDQAKEAALAFLKAVKAKDVDAIMKLTDVPFAYKEGELAVHKEADALKKWMKGRLEELKDPDKVPRTVDEVITFDSLKEKIKTPSERVLAEEVMGKDGFLALVSSDDGKKVGIAVRMKGGKPKIVGLVH
jgi:hypothetical protein